MTLTEQVFAQAALLAGELDGRQTNLLRLLCGASASSLTARLREGLTPEDCKADFIAAASLLALAQLNLCPFLCKREQAQESGERTTAAATTVKRRRINKQFGRARRGTACAGARCPRPTRRGARRRPRT